MAIHMPFDFEFWFVNVFAGDITIFTAMIFLVIALASVRFGFPNIITVISIVTLVLMIPVYFTGMTILIAVFGGIILGWVITRMIN